MPEIIHRPVNRVKENCNWLLQWRGNVTSQIGQDGILQRIFSIIGEGTKFCVEFGAWDGKFLSNTWNLIVNRNWSGVLIEGDPQKFEALETTHPTGRVKTLNRVVGWEGSDALDKILDESDAPQNPDLVSIDVDGNDWHIWKSLVDHRPRVVLIEFNPTIPNDVFFVQDPDPHINHGNSLLAMIERGRHKGYSLICANLWDAFFVVDELYEEFKIPDNSIDSMHHFPQAETKLFQGYDGTFFTAGNRRLFWRDREFSWDALQILPPSERRYGD